MERTVSIRVALADALEFPCDVLVLKHAQALYGLDAAVASRLTAAKRLSRGELPDATAHHFVAGGRALAASEVLFLGTAPLWNLDYEGIRKFGKRTMLTLAKERPAVRRVAMTIHGPGYGLDEIEAFDAQLNGLLDAIGQGQRPDGLEEITFVENRPTRAKRLNEALARSGALQSVRLRRDSSTEREIQEAVRERSAVSARKAHVFVAMPFDPKLDDVWELGIYETVRAAGFFCERVDQDRFTGDILARIKDRIRSARLVIAVLTDANPNVYLEVGYAWGCGTETVLLVDRADALKFDVKGQRCLVYGRVGDLRRKLGQELAGLVGGGEGPVSIL